METYPVKTAQNTQKETLAMLAHDLRTPMSSAVGAAQLAMLAEAQGKPVDAHLHQIVDAMRAMDRMLWQMCEGGTTGTTAQALESELRTMIAPRAAVKHQRLVLDLRGLGNCVLPVDFACLCRVLSNLLVNAVKFTPQGGEVCLSAKIDHAEKHAVFAVCDSGMGMKEAFLSRMYEPGERAQESTKTPGSGLGLTIVQRLVNRMGGTVSAESTWGRGTTFTVRIPLDKAMQ